MARDQKAEFDYFSGGCALSQIEENVPYKLDIKRLCGAVSLWS